MNCLNKIVKKNFVGVFSSCCVVNSMLVNDVDFVIHMTARSLYYLIQCVNQELFLYKFDCNDGREVVFAV